MRRPLPLLRVGSLWPPSLVAKLYLGVLAGVVALCAFCVAVQRHGERLQQEAVSALASALELKALAIRSEALLYVQEDVTKSMLLDPANLEKAARKIEAYDENERVLARMRALAPDGALAGTIERLETLELEEMRPLDTQILERLGGGDVSGARALYFDRYQGLRESRAAEARAVVRQAEARAEAAGVGVVQVRERVSALTTGLVSLGVVLVGVGLGWPTRRVVGRLLRGVEALEAVARGDLTIELPVSSSDEVGRFARALNVAVGSLRESVGAITRTAEVMQGAADRFAKIADRLVGAAEETASRVRRVAEVTQDLDRGLQVVVEGSATVERGIESVGQHAYAAAEVVATAVDRAAGATRAIDQLEQSARRIDKVVTDISTIARQTKLLALNAAIEAAHAGDHGRGFAVVANEVKGLASGTADSTAEIRGVVAAVQSDGEEAATEIREICGVIDRIHLTQSEIERALAEQTEATVAISRSVRGAAAGSVEIGGAVETLLGSAASVSRSATESRRFGAELARLAGELQALVSNFRVA